MGLEGSDRGGGQGKGADSGGQQAMNHHRIIKSAELECTSMVMGEDLWVVLEVGYRE